MKLLSNTTNIKQLLEDIHLLTGCRCAIFGKNFQELYAYPTRLCGFCKVLRENTEIANYCKSDDLEHFKQCESTKTTVVYTCHAHFIEIIAPVIYNDEIVSYFMVGQIYENNRQSDNLKLIMDKYSNLNLNANKLKKEYTKVKNIDKEKIMAIAKIAQISALYLSSIYSSNLIKESFAEEIDNYIINNLSLDLSVDTLCAHFNYKKTNFYKVTNKLFEVPITKHIRELRIAKAKQLLSGTDMKISKIAQTVGIDDYNYFTKVFKADVNCTPREYRKNSFHVNFTDVSYNL